MEFKRPSSPGVQKFKTRSSTGKVQLYFGTRKDTEFMQKGTTVCYSKSYYYTHRKLKTRIRRIKSTRTTYLLHRVNVKSHCSK